MSESAGRSRGRARGRARSLDQSAQGDGPKGPSQARGPTPGGSSQPQGAWGGPRPGTSSGPRPRPQQQGAWGPKPPGPTPQQSQIYQQRAPAPAAQPAVGGRAAMRQGDSRGVIEEPEKVVVGAGGEAGNAAGRGSVRGRRQIACSPLMTRPQNMGSKQGHSGTAIRLNANYFQLITHTNWCLYQYRVDFAPEQESTPLRKQLLNHACREKIPGFVFDGSMLFTPHRIQPDQMELFVNPPGGEGSEEPIRITIRLVGDVAKSDYHLIQFFNIVVRKCLSHMKLQLVGRNYYDALAKIKIPQYDIELWPGYVTSIRQHEDQILMCCEISHKFMRTENVLKILFDCIHEDQHGYQNKFNKRIVGCVVLTDYNNRTYRIDDIDWNVNPQSTFEKADGSSISYIQYYKQRYNIKVSDTTQPMLVSRAKARELRAGMAEIIYLVPELCRMTGLTDNERGNMQMMRALAEHTRLSPEGRQLRLRQYSERMNTTKEITTELHKWDIRLANELVNLPGRILPSENIIQGPRCQIRYPAGQDTDWTRNLRSNPMAVVGEVHTWVVICASGLKRDTFSFVQALQKCAAGMSLNLPSPRLQEIPDDRPNCFLQGLEKSITQFKPNIILCVVSNNNCDRYAAIKKKCCVDKAIPTQVILKKNITSKGVMSIATKVAIQMNCKLGGAPWTVEMPLSNLMVVGFDVCHDTMSKDKSYGGMVASLDKQATRYYTAVSPHKNGEELSNDFAINILKALRQYQSVNNGDLPERIIIYRDGVGDGQLPHVYNHEVKLIEKELKKFYQKRDVKLAFIVVTKRINTRLFAGTRNPPPGTVVDSVVTLPQRYDFFIVSQCVRQGTVSPTSYNVIHDTLGLDPDKLQRLTYKFTHMYYNWSGTVRVPAPCQYAHKLAFLVSQSLHRDPNPQLSNTLFFL